MLVVGSRALMAHGIKVGRKPSDFDIIAAPLQIAEWQERNKPLIKSMKRIGDQKVVFFTDGGQIFEFEIATTEKNPAGLWLLANYEGLGYDRVPADGTADGIYTSYAHPDVVLTLKMSHRYLKNSPHFRKTMDDILALRGLKFRVPPQLQSWLKDREKATYHYAHPSLKRDKAKFFSGDGIDYKYEHDDIHEALATIPLFKEEVGHRITSRLRPAYVRFQKDPDVDVSVSRAKWNECSENIKLNSVLEESYVLALERSQIPCDFAIAPRTSFLIALEKVCTSITSGWWREYAWENYYQVLAMYNDDYVDRFQKALMEGRIREYQNAA